MSLILARQCRRGSQSLATLHTPAVQCRYEVHKQPLPTSRQIYQTDRHISRSVQTIMKPQSDQRGVSPSHLQKGMFSSISCHTPGTRVGKSALPKKWNSTLTSSIGRWGSTPGGLTAHQAPIKEWLLDKEHP